MRESTLVEEKEVARAEAAAEQADLQTAVDKVAAAFAESSLTPEGELKLADFLKCLSDDAIVSKVAEATKMPKSALLGLTEFQLASLFHHIDTDASGTVSFEEWVAALIGIRERKMAALAAERAEHEGESVVGALHEALAEWAFDGDDGQLTQKMTFQEFSD